MGLLCAAAVCTWAAAPAHGAGPQTPRAVDFEQALPPLERVRFTGREVERRGAHEDHLGEGPVSFRSGALEAPQRFDLVGIAGELRPVELRARTRHGEWSDWVEVAGGDPVYTGGSDEVQVRARGWRPRGRLHYVEVSGTASLPARHRTKAAARRPDLVSRLAWGANRRHGGCHPRTTPLHGKVKAAVIHHTVTTNRYSRREAPGIVLGICRFHRNANGWNDIGYNALVDRFGRIYAGRFGGLAKPIVGAHAEGVNAQTTGISAIGTHTRKPLVKPGRRAIARFLAWKFDQHGIRPGEVKGTTRLISAGGQTNRFRQGTHVRVHRVFGHRRTNYTVCPGRALRRQLDAITGATVRRMRRQ
jgi:N-acetylmuramoyl-L-alanine amidase